jgi:hypothetical protein
VNRNLISRSVKTDDDQLVRECPFFVITLSFFIDLALMDSNLVTEYNDGNGGGFPTVMRQSWEGDRYCEWRS